MTGRKSTLSHHRVIVQRETLPSRHPTRLWQSTSAPSLLLNCILTYTTGGKGGKGLGKGGAKRHRKVNIIAMARSDMY